MTTKIIEKIFFFYSSKCSYYILVETSKPAVQIFIIHQEKSGIFTEFTDSNAKTGRLKDSNVKRA